MASPVHIEGMNLSVYGLCLRDDGKRRDEDGIGATRDWISILARGKKPTRQSISAITDNRSTTSCHSHMTVERRYDLTGGRHAVHLK